MRLGRRIPMGLGRRRRRRGGGVLDFLKRAAGSALGFLKNHRLISTGLSSIGTKLGPGLPGTLARMAGSFASSRGYGRRRRVGRPRKRGRGILSGILGMAGLGRRRRVVRRRRGRGIGMRGVSLQSLMQPL
jgi:hypothetical protein